MKKKNKRGFSEEKCRNLVRSAYNSWVHFENVIIVIERSNFAIIPPLIELKKSSTIAASQKFLNLCICSVIKLIEKRFVRVFRLIG